MLPIERTGSTDSVTVSPRHKPVLTPPYKRRHLKVSTNVRLARAEGENIMFDQATRSIWLEDQLWPKLREQFSRIAHLPAEALITVGYPSSGARGRSEKIKPAEVNYQWHGNANEKIFISIHPVYCTSPLEMAKAMLFGAAKATGARWGVSHVGLDKEDDGTLTATPETEAKLEAIIADIGNPPSGYGVAFPVRHVQRGRLRKYVCPSECSNGEAHPVIRAASDTLTVTCTTCKNQYQSA